MSKQVYDVDYFIAKFEVIPEGRWCRNKFRDTRGRCCASGHCGQRQGSLTPENRALIDIIGGCGFIVTEVNDGHEPAYQQATPKARILAALRDAKAKQERKI